MKKEAAHVGDSRESHVASMYVNDHVAGSLNYRKQFEPGSAKPL
jgi:hypothetical protein